MVASINDVHEVIVKLILKNWTNDNPKRKAKILRQ